MQIGGIEPNFRELVGHEYLFLSHPILAGKY